MVTPPGSLTSGPVQAILYLRVSTQEQGREGLSIDAQLAECRRYAARQGWSVHAELSDVMSGLDDSRPAYQELLRTIRTLRAQGVAVAVVVAALDRFGRRLMERVRSREELHALGVPLHTVREGGEVSDLAANILAAVAQEESRRTGERVRAVRAYVQARGWALPAKPPLGYRRRPATEAERAAGAPHTVLELDPEAAPFVREVFARVAAGESVRQAWEWLVGALPAELRGSRRLSFSVVCHLVRRAVYVARPRQGDPDVLARPVGNWPPLVPDELFARVQAVVTRHRAPTAQPPERYLLTGSLRCPTCGARMTGFGPRKRGVTQRRYRCYGLQVWQPGAPYTCTWSCSAARIEAAVLDEVRRAFVGVEPGAPHGTPQGELARVVERARGRLARAALMLIDGDLDGAAYETIHLQVAQELRHAAAALAPQADRAPVTRPAPALDLAPRAGESAAAELGGAPVLAQRAVLRSLLTRVVPVRLAGYAQYGAEITWTPLGEALRRVGTWLGELEATASVAPGADGTP
jgi:DNA invertase Pin-like site-specific DNA recombinase